MGNRKQSIIVAALIYHDGKIFVAKRADTKKYFPGHWELPAGKIEFGESPEEALKREVMEEMHAGINIRKVIHIFSYTFGSDLHDVEIVYLCDIKSEKVITINPEDHSEYRWVAPAEARKLLEDGCPGEADAVQKLTANAEGDK